MEWDALCCSSLVKCNNTAVVYQCGYLFMHPHCYVQWPYIVLRRVSAHMASLWDSRAGLLIPPGKPQCLAQGYTRVHRASLCAWARARPFSEGNISMAAGGGCGMVGLPRPVIIVQDSGCWYKCTVADLCGCNALNESRHLQKEIADCMPADICASVHSMATSVLLL